MHRISRAASDVIRPRAVAGLLLVLCWLVPACRAADAGEKVGKFPHVTFSVQKKQVRVECEALAVNAPLEFFCVLNGTNEHESVLRSPAKPSDIHTALLAVGLKPGQPLTYLEATKKWIPPQGPPLHITVEYQKDGKTVSYPAYRWLREIKSKKEPKAFTWVFCGSRVMKDGRYAADDTGYTVSIVNFDFTLIDIPDLASNSNETLEWERNADLMPAKGTPVWMVIEPAGKDVGGAAPATQPAGGGAVAPPASSAVPGVGTPVTVAVDAAGKVTLDGKPVEVAQLQTALGALKANGPIDVRVTADPKATVKSWAPVVQAAETAGARSVQMSIGQASPDAAPPGLSDVHMDEAKIQALVKYHDQVVGPRAEELRKAAQAHYDVIASLRKEQQRLVTEADLIQRAIDELEKQYADLTTPAPATEPQPQPPASPAPAGGGTGLVPQ